MVEAGAKEVPEEEIVQALEAGHAAIKRIVETIDALAKEAGKPKRTVAKKEYDPAFYREVEEKVMIPLGDAMRIATSWRTTAPSIRCSPTSSGRFPKAKCSARSKPRRSSRS